MSRLGPYGPLPTIRCSRAAGVTSFTVHCSTVYCYRQRSFTFEELELTDDTVFVDIWLARRFRCSKCGRYASEVAAVWPYRPAHR